jgi:hypothetical protein
MPGADQHHQLHFSSSFPQRTYELSSQECQQKINNISFNPAPASMRELTRCQVKNASSRSTPSASFQLQPPCKNLLAVKSRMPGADQHHQLQFSSSHHERTYLLSIQECQEQINTISFNSAPATMRELTNCQAKNTRSRSTPSASILAAATVIELTRCQAKNAQSRSAPSASFQLQPPSETLPTVKPRMPGADKHHQLHSSSSHQE